MPKTNPPPNTNNNYLNHQDINGETPLFAAITRKNYPVAKVLLEYGADPNVAGAYTPLYYAIMQSGDKPTPTDLEFISYLFVRGTNINAQCKHNGQTALHIAAINCANAVTKSNGENELSSEFLVGLMNVFLEADADPTIKDNEGQTPLDKLNCFTYNNVPDYFASFKKRLEDLVASKINSTSVSLTSPIGTLYQQPPQVPKPATSNDKDISKKGPQF